MGVLENLGWLKEKFRAMKTWNAAFKRPQRRLTFHPSRTMRIQPIQAGAMPAVSAIC